ncbi:MAG: ROK family protein [Thermoleophilaceae bacterium]|nr:ROK family protein [Thermoleophilaceae bacterium]
MVRIGGIDLGGTKIQAVVVDESHTVLGQSRRETPRKGGPEAVAAEMAETMRAACEAAGIDTDSLRGVGVGAPGAIDVAAGTVARAGNLTDWDDPYPLGDALTERLGTTVALGNDVNVAVQAEFDLGAAREVSSLLGVFWGTGVGGGIVLNDEMWVGRGAAAEIGHMVVKPGGRRCPCGRHGCMEAYAGRGAMEARARKLVKSDHKTSLFKVMEKRGKQRLASSVWDIALKDGDRMATRLIDEAVQAIGVATASAVNLLDVEMVVIGGGLGIRLGAPYAQRIEEAMLPHLFVSSRPPAVRVAALGDLGGAVGAALLISAESPDRKRGRLSRA